MSFTAEENPSLAEILPQCIYTPNHRIVQSGYIAILFVNYISVKPKKGIPAYRPHSVVTVSRDSCNSASSSAGFVFRDLVILKGTHRSAVLQNAPQSGSSSCLLLLRFGSRASGRSTPGRRRGLLCASQQETACSDRIWGCVNLLFLFELSPTGSSRHPRFLKAPQVRHM